MNYIIPSLWGCLSFYYHYRPHTIWLVCDQRLRRKKHRLKGSLGGGTLIHPKLNVSNEAVTAMLEAMLVRLISRYRAPPGRRTRNTMVRLRYMWQDILDKYFGVDIREDRLLLDIHTVEGAMKLLK